MIVKLRCSNQNDNVDFEFRLEQFAIDWNRNRYRVARDAQEHIVEHGMDTTRVTGGENAHRKFLFDVPTDAQEMKLRVILGGTLGAIVDYLNLGDRFIKLKGSESKLD